MSRDPDPTRPLALGYVQAHPLMTDAELDNFRDQLVTFARTEGYALGSIYVEQTNGTPAAYEALLTAVWQQSAVAVLVPTIHHLAAIGDPTEITDQIQQRTGAHLLAAAGPAGPP